MKDRVRFLGLIPVPKTWRLPGCVRDLIQADGSLYLRRIYLTRNVYLHHIAQADDDRALHNHPWEYATTRILTGGYLEQRTPRFPAWRAPGDVVRLTRNTYHRIALVKPRTWTLFVAGPRVASWGFLVDGKHVDWKKYLP